MKQYSSIHTAVRCALIAGAAAAVGYASAAVAENANTPAKLHKVTVTGTRIKRTNIGRASRLRASVASRFRNRAIAISARLLKTSRSPAARRAAAHRGVTVSRRLICGVWVASVIWCWWMENAGSRINSAALISIPFRPRLSTILKYSRTVPRLFMAPMRSAV